MVEGLEQIGQSSSFALAVIFCSSFFTSHSPPLSVSLALSLEIGPFAITSRSRPSPRFLCCMKAN